MRKILIGGMVALVALAVGSSSAQVPDISVKTPAPVPLVVRTEQVKSLPKLVLPDRKALLRALLRADRPAVAKQLVASQRVVRFFENPDRTWLRAPRQEKCWDVPWQRSCTVARHAYRLHLTLAVAARQRMWKELPTINDWVNAVHVAQRVFPNTESWLLSCSGAEGGHGRFVLYGGRAYYPGAEYARTFHGWMVGNWLQYMWPTFKGHYRHALDSLNARGYKVDLPPPSDVRAWRDPLAVALAGGWAILHGQRSHWSASIGNGC